MDKLFNPKSVAIIGGSTKKEKIGGILVRNLLELKFKGKIYPVNPKYEHIGKLKCYRSVLDIQKKIELALIAVPAASVPGIIEECQARKPAIKNFIIISAGFAESGQAGKKLENAVKRLAHQYRLKIVGPNCLGTINAAKNINLSFAPNTFHPGPIGLITQSGALVSALFDLFNKESLGFSKIVSLGNKAVLDETDFLTYLGRDKATKIIGLYLEDIKRARLFKLAASQIKKPVIVLDSGSSASAKNAILSHTGALAPDYEVTAAALEDAGALLTNEIDRLVDSLKLFSGFKPLKNGQVAILTNAGGPGVITTDLITKSKHLALRRFSSREKKTLERHLPAACSVKNPIDILGDANPQRYYSILQKLVSFKNIGAVIALATKQSNTDLAAIFRVIAIFNKRSGIPVIPVIIGQGTNLSAKYSLPLFTYPSALIDALDSRSDWQQRQKLLGGKKIKAPKIKRLRTLQSAKIIQRHTNASRKILSYFDSSRLLALYGLDCLPAHNARQVNPAALLYPQVLKIDSPQILHKTQKSGVIKNINRPPEFTSALKRLGRRFKNTPLITQKQVADGLELIFGVKSDPGWGPLILLGLGGVLAETINLKNIWILPVSDRWLKYKLERSGLAKIFAKQKISASSVIHELKKVALLATENPRISALDINPIIFYPDRRPIIVDVKIIL